MMRNTTHLALFVAATLIGQPASANGPWLGNGIKSGEPTQTSIILWTRLTERPDISSEGVEWPMVRPERQEGGSFHFPGPQIPEGHTLNDMAYTLPGAPGDVRLRYWPESAPDQATDTGWVPVAPEADYTRHFPLTGLQPGAQYRAVMEARATGGAETTQTVQGTFRTAPAPDADVPVTFTVVTGQDFWLRDDDKNGHKIYAEMLRLAPDFFVHTGDIVYFDRERPWAVNAEQARHKWHRMFALPYQRNFHNHTSSYFLRDDHETWQDDAWPTLQNNKMGDLTYADGVEIFFEQVPGPDREKPWRTVRWGQDLQIWLVEGRDFRSANTDPDGPEKTIWGTEQKAWFKKTVTESDATFRVLVSPTPVVGPDRETKADNHANKAFAHEGAELRQFMAEQENMLVICGDRHWQYASTDPVTGLREFCSGPSSDAHAGGFSEDQRTDMHQYLKVIGGFLSCTAERRDGAPALVLRHFDVNGQIVYEEALTPDSILRRP
ncbi:MAG: alkaline phosphatase D family protein [Candidatus Hydrogenedentes bacterium]|nr:alkaline phosphatase D family protein [Candidatus Hydrogenedentota bacterium]